MQPTIHETELPRLPGAMVTFWHAGREFSIKSEHPDCWTVFRSATTRHQTRLTEFTQHPGGYVLVGENADSQQPVIEWRELVRTFLT